MKYAFLFLFITSVVGVVAQPPKSSDLTFIRFDENPEILLKSIPYEKLVTNFGITRYFIKNTRNYLFNRSNMEFQVLFSAANSTICSYYAKTQRTVTTKKVIKSLLAKYGPPTKKLYDDGDTRSYYWITPEVFVKFQSGTSISPILGPQNFSAVTVATIKSLDANVDSDKTDLYKFVLKFNGSPANPR